MLATIRGQSPSAKNTTPKRSNNFLTPGNSNPGSRNSSRSPAPKPDNNTGSKSSLTTTPNRRSATNLHSDQKAETIRMNRPPLIPKPNPQKGATSDREEPKKMQGIWDQYQDSWFVIQCQQLNPMFMELPTPKRVRSLCDLDAVKQKEIPQIQPKENRTQYKSSYQKFKDMENPVMETCEGCNTKKRKGIHIGCNHFMCRECLQSHIKKNIEQEKVNIKCMRKGCKYELDKTEINKYAANTEIMKKYADLCVSKYVEKHPHQLVQCFTPGCGYVVDLSKLKQKEVLNCSRCKNNYCMRCHKPVHTGAPCDDN
jgi:hypothetical protein